MNSSFVWICMAVVVAAFVAQGYVLRSLHRRRLVALEAAHEKLKTSLLREIEQLTERLLLLRSEVKQARLTASPAESAAASARSSAVAARQALERKLDVESASRRATPTDGFVDTQVMDHIEEPSSLLLR